MAAVLVVAGLLALAASLILIGSFGSRLRVARLLRAAPVVGFADLRDLAASPRPPLVRVQGRIDSEEDFEDADHRPLVFRRTAFQLRRLGGWRTVDETREQVPFTVGDATGVAAVDPDDLRDGLVVVPREASGVAGDVTERVPVGTPPATPLRVRIDQVSSVEHAIVVGVPVVRDGTIRLAPGRGRPLVLTTLEPDEAMRILADGRQNAIRAAVGLFVAGAVAVVAGAALVVTGAP